MKFSVLTFGCRTNEADSSLIERRLSATGGVPAAPGESDLVVVNTCSVTSAAEQAGRQAIRRVARVNPAADIVVTGCSATRRPGDLAALPGVVAVVGNEGKEDLFKAPPDDGLGTSPRPLSLPVPGMRGRTTFTLCVQTGCDEACSYCIVPSTRGASRSVPAGQVLDEAAALTAAGFREIVLTGVHLGAWGRDLSPRSTLAGLLAALDALPGPTRFRLSSLEPMDCSPAVIDLVASSPRFQPHFHLPLQHASASVLKAMRRPYTLASYRELVQTIRMRLPQAAIGSDVIAGFPGESEQDALVLQDYLADSPITHLHVFPYSSRPGTAAVALQPRVPGPVVRERARRLRSVGRSLTRRFEAAHVGRVIEGLTLRDGSVVLTDNFLKVRVPPLRPRNERVRVRVLSADPLQGQIVP